MATSISSVPSEALVNFARGTIATLKLWSALKIAIDSGWGGPESTPKRQWLASVIVDAFEEAENKKEPLPDAIYIEEMLLQILSDEFDVVLEDGSAQPIAEKIVELWQEVMYEGSSENVFKLENMATKLQGKKVNVEEKVNSDDECDWDDDDDDEEGSSEAEVPALLNTHQGGEREQSEVDEDGFTVVKGRGRTNH
ncbi:hypothetical protein Clacol_002030 [Clathrus columnatus]|uniref:Pre-rRNA-processing protein TSR2 homolog n=1 Tax=Clathrus columnatus TaxID=1419009 RepID=A0AAV5A7E0_9AGAM|nr:hypothetical protein Clacol_002030 [Clathrus columnatus]